MLEIISYWFFVWFLLFIFGIIKQNPFWILVVSYIITLFELVYLVLRGANKYNLIKFTIINVFIKFIPILYIFQVRGRAPIMRTNDIIFAIIIIFIYLILLELFRVDAIKSYQNMLYTYIMDDDKYRTFPSRIYDSIVRP